MAKRFLVLIALLMLGFYIAGCAEGDESASVVNPNPDPFAPVGSISGTVFDFCKSMPVQGAVVSVAYSGKVHKVTTGKDGGFSFANVPANGYGYSEMIGFGGGYYEVVCDLSNIKNTAGTPTYNYSTVMPAFVTYNDLWDGDNADQNDREFTESGSGASTPVTNLASTVTFAVAQPNAIIKVNLTDVTAVDAGTAISGTPVAATSVLLYRRLVIDEGDYIDELVGPFTADATVGSYTIANILPVNNTGWFAMYDTEYYVQVVKSGYSLKNSVGCIGTQICCLPGCGQTVSDTFALYLDPDRDNMIPYIKTIDVGTKTDVISGDIQGTWTTADVTSFVVHFNEAMNTTRSTKCNSVFLESHGFTVTVTSAGTSTTSPVHTDHTGVDLVKDYTLAWSADGKDLTVTPVFYTNAELVAMFDEDGYAAGYTVAVDNALGGRFHLEFMPVTPHLTDVSMIPWSPLGFDGFDMSSAAAYQTNYILIAENTSYPLEDEWYLWFGIGDQCDYAEYANYGLFDYSCEY